MIFSKKKDSTAQLESLLVDYSKKESPEKLREIAELFPQVPFFYTNLTIEIGPDNFPYLNLELRSEKEKQITLKEIADKALHGGFGVTINKSAHKVDWVFSLGDMIPLARMGNLVLSNGNNQVERVVIKKETKVLVGEPNEDIIPLAVRKHLRKYIQINLNIANPRFFLMYNPKDNPLWTVMFNSDRNAFHTESEFERVLRPLSWFFPKTVFIGSIKSSSYTFFDI